MMIQSFIHLKPETDKKAQLQKIQRKEVGKFNFGVWKNEKMGFLCNNIEEWLIIQLHASSNLHPQLLLQIEHIRFSRLEKLVVDANQISSIENFPRIHFPILNDISFSSNQVFDIRIFRKCSLPHIKRICIQSNFIGELKNLPTMDLLNFESLWIQRIALDEDQCPDIKCLIKLNCELLKFLYIRRRNRINQERLHFQMETKWEKMKIQKYIQEF